MANTKLPLGLTRYAGNKFKQLHDGGCKCLTASNVPDLFGLGRNGRLGLSGHALGIMPIEVKETSVIKRGQRRQELVADWYAEETGYAAKSVHAWVKHPDMDLYASPDVLRARWDTVEGRFPADKDIHPGEIKVVAESVFDDQWVAGPPQKVLLQHQTQLALTGASTGPVIAEQLGEFVDELHHWEVDAHKDTQEIVISEAWEFLTMVAAGELPEPDLSSEQDQNALIRMATVTEGMKVDLPDELLFHVKRYQRSGVIQKRCDKRRTEAKARLLDALGGAELGVFADGQTVKFTKIEYKEQTRKAYSAVRMNIGKQKTAPAKRAPLHPIAFGTSIDQTHPMEETVGDSQNGV